MRALVAGVILAGACGRLRFEARDDGGQAPADIGDAAPDAPLPTGPFTTVEQIPELVTTFDDDDPTLTADQLEMYFNSNRGGGQDIWVTTRAAITDPWGPPALVPELSETGVTENTPEIAADGLTIYITSNRGTGDDIYVFTRATRADSWSAISRVTELSDPAADVGVALRADGLVLYMARILVPNSNEIMRATRPSVAATWGAPVLVSELSNAQFDSDPAISADDRTIYWVSRRNTGADEIWMADRSTASQPFGNIRIATDVSSPLVEADPWLSPDGHTMYFARVSTGGGYTIYRATR